MWGQDPKYLHGALQNAKDALTVYPGWVCRFYVASSVPTPIVDRLANMSSVQIVSVPKWGDWCGFFWRYAPASEKDVEVMISRDVDCRLGHREKAAVDEWMASDKGFHIMRDHPWHQFPVLGGMWGAKRGVLPQMNQLIEDFPMENIYEIDYKFFQEAVLPNLKQSQVMVHDEFFGGKPFPTPRENYEFVGQVFDESDETIEEHVLALKRALE